MPNKKRKPTPKQCAWLAGFFDGDGCVSIRKTKRGNSLITLSIGQAHLGVLKYIQTITSLGTIYFRKIRFYQWRVGNKEDTEKFINYILPYSKVKREQLELALEYYKLYGLRNIWSERLKIVKKSEKLKREGFKYA